MNSEIEGPGFTFKDSRSSSKSEEELKADRKQDKPEGKTADKKEEALPDLEFDFSTFVLSLASSAFYHLGDLADPHTGEKRVELPAVKQTIDILIMLRDKTKGNLNKDEEKLLEQLTYELQVKYLAQKK
ncbi:MAG: DUF1844 domain-containing protein [Nitrospinae bacterium]|nr:DUF1844 domain-containing protein [Nitrospinota bacterium]